MTGEEAALRRAVLLAPDDDTPRLVYADWLDEHDERVACARCGRVGILPARRGPERCPDCSGSGRAPGPLGRRAEFIKVQVELARLEPYVMARGGTTPGPVPDPEVARFVALKGRERELWGGWPDAQDVRSHVRAGLPRVDGAEWAVLPGSERAAALDSNPDAVVARGFVSEVRMGLAAFLRHAAALFRAHPVGRVTLSDRAPDVDDEGGPLPAHWWDCPHGGLQSICGENCVPADIARRLTGDRSAGELGVSYRTREAGLADLSAACVGWGREQAGLPPPEDP